MSAPGGKPDKPLPELELRASFRELAQATREDFRIIMAHARPFLAGLADRVLMHMQLLKGDFGGFPVDRLEHCLQTATRAHRAGKDEEYVVCALLHDIGDTLGAHNHPDIAAAILKPFVSERNLWMVQNHGAFQGYFYYQHIGLDPDMREQFRGHEYFDYTAEFAGRFDQAAFDAAYRSMSLEEFAPAVRRLFSAPKESLYANALSAEEAAERRKPDVE